MAVMLALGAALANALTSILQRSAAEEAPKNVSFTMKLITFVIRKPIWIAGMATMIAGFLLQAVALRFGRLSTVQPILTTEIVFLLIIMWLVFRLPLRWPEWLSGVGIALGLAVFLGTARPSGGYFTPGPSTWIPTGIAGFVGVVITAGLAMRTRHGSALKAGLFGSSSAIAFAFAATIMKEEASIITRDGWVSVFSTWLPYTMAVVGVGGLFLAQNAFHSGPVAASQSALTIVDPITSILIGVAVFNENIQAAGWEVAIEAVSLIVMMVGVMTLSRSETVTRARFDKLPERRSHEDHVSGVETMGEVIGETLPGGQAGACRP